MRSSHPDPCSDKDPVRFGRLIASVLAGAWRASPPPPPPLSSTALTEVTPLLLSTGAASLAWRRVPSSQLRTSTAAHELRQAYRLYALQNRRAELQIVAMITCLRSAGVEPLLVKGWAVSRLYAEHGLRPYGDIDLCVRPDEFAVAAAALAALGEESGIVDLHQGLRQLQRPSLGEVYQRSQLVPLGDIEVGILGPEDHLRYICVHMLEHGAYRALWLCDVAVMVESAPEEFDWDYLLWGNQRHAGWVVSSVALAHELLGARLECVPAAERAIRPPRWLVLSVLSQWSTAEHYMDGPSMAYSLRHPTELAKSLRLRWPNPILATVRVGGPFNDLPRLPFQLWECVLRIAHFLTQIPTLIRQRSLRAVGGSGATPVAVARGKKK